jgi:hypothetical protein
MSFEFILRSHEHPDESDEAPVLTIEISDRLLVSASSERANQQQVRQRISKGQYLRNRWVERERKPIISTKSLFS